MTKPAPKNNELAQVIKAKDERAMPGGGCVRGELMRFDPYITR